MYVCTYVRINIGNWLIISASIDSLTYQSVELKGKSGSHIHFIRSTSYPKDLGCSLENAAAHFSPHKVKN